MVVAVAAGATTNSDDDGDGDQSDSGGDDVNAVIISYDRLANGWQPAPFPPGRRGLSALFTMRVEVSRS